MRRVAGVVLIMFLIAGLNTGCKKKEEQITPKAGEIPAVPLQTPMGQVPAQPLMSPHGDGAGMGPKVEKAIVVPDSVKGKWSKVILAVEDKGSGKTDEYTVNLKSEFKIPGSDLKIAVREFLPDFKMTEDTITSGSNELINPAVRVEIFEKDKSVFKGWLYEKFPSIHPFNHPKYAIMLKKSIKS
ncbi:MAG: DUF2155 domain-containing protein [Nitrospirae bacterium]|nr:DUF2155 domain-containing protein [Nitrospirota bacterium]